MSLMELKNEISSFNAKLKLVEEVFIAVFKLKNPLGLTVNHCEVKDSDVVIVHPNIPTQIIPEEIFGDSEKILARITANQEAEARKKKIYDLKWQIDYWMKELNQESIDKKQAALVVMQEQLKQLTKEPQ